MIIRASMGTIMRTATIMITRMVMSIITITTIAIVIMARMTTARGLPVCTCRA